MVEIPNEVKSFLENVKKKFTPQHVYVFGSRATGRARPDSDWDFIIVSEKFSGVDGYRRAVEVYRLSTGDFAFDVLCFTPEEFEAKKAEPSLVQQSLENNELVEVVV